MAHRPRHSPPRRRTTPGQFFQIVEPITHETFARRACGHAAARRSCLRRATGGDPARSWFSSSSRRHGAREQRVRRLLRPGELDLAELAGAKLTVAYVPQPLKGFAVLPAVACTEIVMGVVGVAGPDHTRRTATFDPAQRDPVRFLAIRKTREPDLLLGMLDRDADLRMVRTADRAVHYVLRRTCTSS